MPCYHGGHSQEAVFFSPGMPFHNLLPAQRKCLKDKEAHLFKVFQCEDIVTKLAIIVRNKLDIDMAYPVLNRKFLEIFYLLWILYFNLFAG